MTEGIYEKNQEWDGGVYGLQKCPIIHHLSPDLEESQPHSDMLLNQLHIVMMITHVCLCKRHFLYILFISNITVYLTSGNINYAIFLHQKI